MRSLALLAIHFYQRFISPYKGFCCAYGVHTGHASCSVLGYRAVRRYGLWQGVQVLDERMARCGIAYRRALARPLERQAGSCDLPCDGPCDIDLPSPGKACQTLGNAADCADCADCCDWNRSRKKRRAQDDTYIPPRSNRRRPPREH